MKFINYLLVLLLLILACSNENKDSLDVINKNAYKNFIDARNNRLIYQVKYSNPIWKKFVNIIQHNEMGYSSETVDKLNSFISDYPKFLPAKLYILPSILLGHEINEKVYEYIKDNIYKNDTLKAIVYGIKYVQLSNDSSIKSNIKENVENLIDTALTILPDLQVLYAWKASVEDDYNEKFRIYDEALKKDSLCLLIVYCIDAFNDKRYKKVIELSENIENKNIEKKDYKSYIRLRSESYEKLNDLTKAEKDYILLYENEEMFYAKDIIGFYKRNNYSKTQILEKIKDLIKNHNYKLEYFDEYKDDKELLKMLDKK